MPAEIVWAPGKSTKQLVIALQRVLQTGVAVLAVRVPPKVSSILSCYLVSFILPVIFILSGVILIFLRFVAGSQQWQYCHHILISCSVKLQGQAW